MDDARVLVTGGAGAVGSTLVDHLLAEGAAEVVVLDRFERGSADNLTQARQTGRVVIVDADIRDRSAVRRAMEGIDLVFHQAAIRITRCAEEPRMALEVMVDGTFNVIEAAVEHDVRKVVFASSAAVYGAAETYPTTEDHHLHANRTLYGTAKAFGESLLRSFHEMYGIDYVALRYYNVYGPRMDIRSQHTEVLVRWLDRIAAGQPPLILGDGSQTMDFVYVDDVARANVLAARANVTDEVLNVASGAETSLRRLAGTLLRVMGSDLQPEYGPARGVNHVPRRVGDPTKAQRLIGFRAEVMLEEGLRRLFGWWAEQRSPVPTIETGVR